MTLRDDLHLLVVDWYGRQGGDYYADELSQIMGRHGSRLTSEQAATLVRLAAGASITDIAEHFDLSYGGVTARLARLHQFYGVSNTAQTVVSAARSGDIDLDSVDVKWEGNAPSAREIAALQAVADHGSNAASGRALNASGQSIKARLRAAAVKAGALKRVDLLTRAMKAGYIQ